MFSVCLRRLSSGAFFLSDGVLSFPLLQFRCSQNPGVIQDGTADHQPRDQKGDRLRETGDDAESQHVHAVLRDLFFQHGNVESLPDGAVMKIQTALCLESQYAPDSPNQPNFPSCVLRKDEEYNFTTVYKFGVRK